MTTNTHPGTPLILIDMDGVIADLETGFWDLFAAAHPSAPPRAQAAADQFYLTDQLHPVWKRHVKDLLNAPGFFAGLPAMPGAADALNAMLAHGWDVRICTAPSLTNPTCASDKLAWLEANIGAGWAKRAIIAKDKSYVRGDLLIDDKPDPATGINPTWKHVVFNATYNHNAASPHRLTSWAAWKSELPAALGIGGLL